MSIGQVGMDSMRKTYRGPWSTFTSGIRLLATPQISPETVLEIQRVFGNDIVPTGPDITILKQARQRRVLRLNTSSGSVIAKLFPLKNPSSILRHRKYARREFSNYMRVQELGIDTPVPLAFLEYRVFGFVRMSGLIIEDIQDVNPWHETSDGQVYLDQALACIPTLVALFARGVNHVDARDENLLRVGGRTVVIDWQYASFVEPKADWLLEHLAAYFVRNAPEAHRTLLHETWLGELHKTAKVTQTFEQFRANTDALLSVRQSVKARLTLRPAKVPNT
jgi:hypothetical protein